MKKSWAWLFAVPLVGAGVAVFTAARAADHLDGPRASADPAADITDVYAFMSPDPLAAKHLVLVMNVFPLANAQSSFSNKVTYTFRLKPITNANPLTFGAEQDVVCTFAAGSMSCTAGGVTKAFAVGGAAGTCATADQLCVYAGLRSDPFYFDLKGFKDSVAANAPKFTGTNFFQGLNVLSIVVEVDPTLFNSGAATIFTVGADTTRKP